MLDNYFSVDSAIDCLNNHRCSSDLGNDQELLEIVKSKDSVLFIMKCTEFCRFKINVGNSMICTCPERLKAYSRIR